MSWQRREQLRSQGPLQRGKEILEGGRGEGGGEKVSLLSLSPFFALLFPHPPPPRNA